MKNEELYKTDHNEYIEKVNYIKEKCDFCRICEEACVYDALEIVGREVSVEEIMEEIEKDRVFFDESGGGVTFSGGEPLLQVDFLDNLMEEIKKSHIHIALDPNVKIIRTIGPACSGIVNWPGRCRILIMLPPLISPLKNSAAQAISCSVFVAV